MKTIAFAWYELPNYAARLIRHVVCTSPYKVIVVGTPGKILQENLEAELGQKVLLVQADQHTSWEQLDLASPDYYFQSGYLSLAFNSLGSECRKNGGKAICMTDATWFGSLRQQTVDPVRHRLLLRRSFDGMFVTGQLGLKYANRMGYSRSAVYSGLLGADPKIFSSGGPIEKRESIFLYVGRLSKEKNVRGLCKAFIEFAKGNSFWKLQICGDGDEGKHIPVHPQIERINFADSDKVSSLMKNAKFLVLPSFRDAWGVVVHEACLSGCALLLSSRIGSKLDLASLENSIQFEPKSLESMRSAFTSAASWSDKQLVVAAEVSVRNSTNFGPSKFAESVNDFINQFEKGH